MKVPFVNLGLQYKNYRKDILYKFDNLSKKGQFILGDEVSKFENEFARYCNTKYAIGLGSGSDALTFSLKYLELNSNDEVIIPGNSFIATAWTVANVGAKIVFADVKDDYNIDPDKIEKLITKNTKAIIPVHLTGRVADMIKINKIAKEYNLKVIEDAAQSVGAIYKNKKSGSLGLTGCFSLHPLKNLHIHGDGGILTTDNKKIYEYVKQIRNHGLVNRDKCKFWGYNSRLDNVQAAIARIKLKNLNRINNKFIKIAKLYNSELKNIIRVPVFENNKRSIYHRYIVQVEKRRDLINYLNKKNIETKINYPIPLHLQPAAKNLNYKVGSLPNVEKQSKKILSLPIYAEINNNQIEYVINNIKKFYKS